MWDYYQGPVGHGRYLSMLLIGNYHLRRVALRSAPVACAKAVKPTWTQRCMRVDSRPWVPGADCGGALLRERSLMQRASSYGQPLFSRPNYYCTFMTRMFRVLGRRRIVFCVCENQIIWSLNTWHSYIIFNAKNNFNAIRSTIIAKPAISVLNLSQIVLRSIRACG